MNQELEALTKFIYQRKQELLEDVRRRAKKLRLNDILKEVEDKGERSKPNWQDIDDFQRGNTISFSIGQGYSVIITPKSLAVDFWDLRVREYKGRIVSKFYQKMEDAAIKEKENPIPF